MKRALLAQREKLAADAKARTSTGAGGGVRAKGEAYFQVVHFSILDNHIHLIVEASDRRTLGRGIAGLEVRIARRINARIGRKGSLWSGRYHRRDLRTPSEVRGVLRYVLMNARKHYRHVGDRSFADPLTSAATFDGFARSPVVFDDDNPWPRVVPRTWLLGVGWRTHGLLDPAEAPAASARSIR